MFYALAHIEDSFFSENLGTFVAMAPCTIWSGFGPDNTDNWYSSVAQFPDYGVYYLGGAN